MASKSNPIYSVGVATTSGLDVQVDGVITTLKLSESENELAQKVHIVMANTECSGKLLSEIINVRDRVFIYANDGEKVDEVFRGFVWTKQYTNDNKKYIDITVYDNLIYLMKSEDSRYYPSGQQTEDIINDICWAWGLDLVYDYETIEHKKLPLSGKIANFLTSDLLDKVKKKTKIKYVIRSKQDIVYIERAGANASSLIYELNRSENVMSTSSETTLDKLITKVIITGKKNDDGSVDIKDTLEGNTEVWGTLQKIVRDTSRDDEDEKEDEDDKFYENAQDEAQYILDEYGEPKVTFQINAVDIPWLRKGDLVKVNAGDMAFRYIILNISHNVISKVMNLKLEFADESKLKKEDSKPDSGEINAGRAVELDHAPVYEASDKDPGDVADYYTGTYYIYDGKEIRGRYRICKDSANVGRKPVNKYVDAWLDAKYVN